MSAGSGIQVGDDLKAEFASAQTGEGNGFIKIEIIADKFKKTGAGRGTGSRGGDFLAIQGVLEARKPAYVLKNEEKDKWLLIFYMPDNCTVRERMIYASSTAALKLGLGSSKITTDFTIRDPKECTTEHQTASKEVGDTSDLLTKEESLRQAAEKDSIMSAANTTSKMSGMSGLPIQSAEDAVAAFEGVRDGKFTTAIFFLDPANELMSKAATGNFDFDAIAKQLPAKEPRFVLQKFKHEYEDKKATSNVFFYYCPDVAPPRLKMFYSSTKSNVVAMCEKFSLQVTKAIEVSVASEVTRQLVFDELYPKAVEKKTFSKPGKPGKGGSRLHGGAKFSAS